MGDRHGTGIGVGLRMARQARGLTQQQLAAMAGMARQTISMIESGLSDPSLRNALALARALEMTAEELFGPVSSTPSVPVRPVATLGSVGARVALAPMGDEFVALPLRGDAVSQAGFFASSRPANPAVQPSGATDPATTAAAIAIPPSMPIHANVSQDDSRAKRASRSQSTDPATGAPGRSRTVPVSSERQVTRFGVLRITVRRRPPASLAVRMPGRQPPVNRREQEWMRRNGRDWCAPERRLR
jgi:transcriptional regulator with XRE-family HTH domain